MSFFCWHVGSARNQFIVAPPDFLITFGKNALVYRKCWNQVSVQFGILNLVGFLLFPLPLLLRSLEPIRPVHGSIESFHLSWSAGPVLTPCDVWSQPRRVRGSRTLERESERGKWAVENEPLCTLWGMRRGLGDFYHAWSFNLESLFILKLKKFFTFDWFTI